MITSRLDSKFQSRRLLVGLKDNSVRVCVSVGDEVASVCVCMCIGDEVVSVCVRVLRRRGSVGVCMSVCVRLCVYVGDEVSVRPGGTLLCPTGRQRPSRGK